ncbi:hypothetical protein lacNasYZ03_12590 [Lactobacillus nasalidis]|uniref:ABC transporter permease n=1 Tax=Lactobacillus nasalidis TaxID=2797258 RepID=A0ABQ3W7H2_9LACO|nr:ABC transporter permease [Lactobacillus nasalidis]GHV97658.1 hypothetical protein lacNasYZ01_08400 [Lactobacillus nasalidis]GHV98609.1 hypothetical protein lacNasYZ02_00390 [Lactobacillus nasalidis]GHW01572.1 hypothetical protein lacNasYZ03_12590 [Lactobacillus nasalidis]
MYFEFIKNVFLKKVVLTLLTLLCLVSFGFISYHLLRSNLYVINNERSLQTLVKRKVYVGNDQSTGKQFSRNFKQKNLAKTNAHARKVFAYLDKNYHYSLRWSFDSNLNNGDSVSIDTVNSNFFKFYLLHIAAGRKFNSADYASSSSSIPVLVGANVAKSQPLGSKFTAVNSSSGKKEHYQVVGVLQQNANVPSVYLLDNQNYLNNTIIRPLRQADKASVTAAQLLAAAQDLIVFDSSRAELAKLTRKFNQGNFFKIRFISVEKNISDFYASYKGTAIMFAVFSLAIMAVAVLIIVWNTWNCLNEEQSEIALRISLGMRQKDVLTAAIIYQLVIDILAIVPVLLYAGSYSKMLAASSVGSSSQIVLNGLLPRAETASLLISFVLMLLITVFAIALVAASFNRKPLALQMGDE